MLELDLAVLPDWPRIPRGVSVVRLASAAWVARVSVEIVGPNGQTVADAVWCVQHRLDECRRAEAAIDASLVPAGGEL